MNSGLQRTFDPVLGWTPLLVQPDAPQRIGSQDFTMLVVGASIEGRTYEQYGYGAGGCVRQNGIVTVTAPTITASTLYPGNQIRNGNANYLDIEGEFTVLTNDGTTMTYADPRPDLTTATDGGGLIYNKQLYSTAGGWANGLSLATEGRVRPVVIATSGSQVVDDWGIGRVTELVNAMVANGRSFGCVVVNLFGNAILAAGYSEAVITAATLALVDRLTGLSGLIYLEDPPANRNVNPALSAYTTASRFLRKLHRYIVGQRPFVRVIPFNETLAQNYGAVSTNDVAAGWPEQQIMQSDGTHTRFDGSLMHGMGMGEAVYADLQSITNVATTYGQNRHVNSIADPAGALQPNGGPCWFGAFTTVAATGPATGLMPQACSIAVTNAAAGMTVVSSVAVDDEGGRHWTVDITDNTGIASGSTTTMIVTGSPADATGGIARAQAPTALLDFLTAADVVGKSVDLFVPATLRLDPAHEFQMQQVEMKLLGTIGGVQYALTGPFSNQGVNKMDATFGMSQGFSGVLRSPRFTCPAGLTAVELDFAVKSLGSQPTGTTRLVLHPGLALEVIN